LKLEFYLRNYLYFFNQKRAARKMAKKRMENIVFDPNFALPLGQLKMVSEVSHNTTWAYLIGTSYPSAP